MLIMLLEFIANLLGLSPDVAQIPYTTTSRRKHYYITCNLSNRTRHDSGKFFYDRNIDS